MNPDFTLIWPLSCPKDGDHFCRTRWLLHDLNRRYRFIFNETS